MVTSLLITNVPQLQRLMGKERFAISFSFILSLICSIISYCFVITMSECFLHCYHFPQCNLFCSLILILKYDNYKGDADGTPDGQETVSQLVQTGMVLEMKR